MTPQQPQEFAALLIQKLEAVKRDRESEEKLLRIVAEVSEMFSFWTVFTFKNKTHLVISNRGIVRPVGWTSLAHKVHVSDLEMNAQLVFWPKPCPKSLRQMKQIRNQFSVILGWFKSDFIVFVFFQCRMFYFTLTDNHVQRIWADQTPLRSPGAPSPRPWSPENRRRLPPNVVANPTKTSGPPIMSSSAYSAGYFQRSSVHHRRKDKVRLYFFYFNWILIQDLFSSSFRISKKDRPTLQILVPFSIKVTVEEKIELTFPSRNRFLILAVLVWRRLLEELVVPSVARNLNTIVSMTVVSACIQILILVH